MSVAWVAGTTRARLLLDRRAGPARAREIARAPTASAAASSLAGTGYGSRLAGAARRRDAERAVLATALWHLRVLAGWLPPAGVELLRALAAGYEISNATAGLEAQPQVPGATPRPASRPPFELGGLATSRALSGAAGSAPARGAPAVRDALARSAWGDPGTDARDGIRLYLRLTWARRVLARAPEAVALVCGALALLVAREALLLGRPPGPESLRDFPWLRRAVSAGSPREMARRLPERASWALEGVRAAEDLWRAEAAWLARAEAEAERAVGGPGQSRRIVAAAATLLVLDARRTAHAMALAGRPVAGAREALDALG